MFWVQVPCGTHGWGNCLGEHLPWLFRKPCFGPKFLGEKGIMVAPTMGNLGPKHGSLGNLVPWVTWLGLPLTSQTSNIMKFQYNLCVNHETICLWKNHGLQNVKMTRKINKYYFYINDASFILMMFWCEVHTIYILTKSLQLLWSNFA